MANNISAIEAPPQPFNSDKVWISGPEGIIVFEASSQLQEDRQANYQGFNIVHLPASLYSYHSTAGRKFSITGKLVSRTPDEADQNAFYLDLARSWILPAFGSSGATPPILKLSGYRNNNIDRLQVVLTSYGWAFPEEIDFIWGGTVPMPVIGNLQLNLEEVYSAEQITNGAWKQSLGAGAAFDREGTKGEKFGFDSRARDKAGSLSGFVNDRKTQTIGGLLSNPLSALTGPGIKPTIAGVLVGNLTRKLGTQLLNSPAIREITKQLPPMLSNVFVSGSNIAIGQLGKTATLIASAGTLKSSAPAAPTFSRAAPLPVPTFIGYEERDV